MVSVMIVAGYPSVRAGLRALLSADDEIEVIGEWADDDWDAAPISTDHPPDVLLIDVDPDSVTGPERILARVPDAAAVLLYDRPDDFRQFESDLNEPIAALLKDAEAAEIAAAIHAVSRGLVVLDPAIATRMAERAHVFPRSTPEIDERLTEREQQVLQLLALGLPNKTIAQELGISEHTAKFHVGSIMTKLGAASRTEAVALAARSGLLIL